MRKLLFVILLAVQSLLVGQVVPDSYSMLNKKLFKTTANSPLSNSIVDIVIDDEGNVWIGTSRGLSMTPDNGDTWTNFFNYSEFGDEGIYSVAHNNGVIWVATGHSYELEGGDVAPEGSGLHYTEDYGSTWTKIDQPVDDPGDSSLVYGINTIRALPVTVKVYNVTYDFAFTGNTVWIASYAGGVRKSDDMGQTWDRVLLPSDSLDSISPTDTLNYSLQTVAGDFGPESWLNHVAFSVVSVDDLIVYAGTAGGINKSINGGISWRKFNHVNQTNSISGDFITAMNYDKSTQTVWAASWKAEGSEEFWGVSASSDGGRNWRNFLPDERAHNFGFKYFGSAPDYSGSHVFVATDNGIYRTSDKGESWVSPPSIKDDVTKIPISTTIFYSVAANRLEDNSTDVWIGSDNGLAKLNETSGFWSGDWKVFLASSGDSKSDETYAFPNPFSPHLTNVKIKYSVTSTSADVSLRIFDFGMNLVKTMLQNAPRGTNENQFEFWDGRDERGRLVPNGVYFYRLDINDNDPLFGKIMVLK